MKKILLLTTLFIVICSSLSAQVGIGNTSPEAALDISSTNSGILIPRIGLNSVTDITTVTNPNGGGAPVVGTLVFNNGTGSLSEAGFYHWNGTRWNKLIDEGTSSVYFGKMIINSAGTITESGIGFEPTFVEFIAANRAQGYNDGAYASNSNNSNDIRMAGGFTTGYAKNNGAAIEQQVISSAYSGSSLNNIGTYTSSNHCLAALFVDNNGRPLQDNGTSGTANVTQEGLIRASMQSFNNDGFTLNVDRFISGPASPTDRTNTIVVIYKAYRN